MTNQDELLLHAQRVIRGLREKLAARSPSSREPVAIVGMACRFPCGSGDVDAFWQTTLAGASAVRDLPVGRWDTESYPGSIPQGGQSASTTFRACFLDHPAAFDADFFGISSREATQMDPAQRLFLEVAWHALEDAGQTKRSLAGSDTAVFAGNTGVNEFLAQHLSTSADIDIYTGTGTGTDVIAGRLSYLLDLQGPCATVNTACSSSLVALHLARRSLLAGECNMAVAGGVNVLGPVSTAMASRMDFLAPDGCCKPFDEHADGFGRGEGCGVVILKRLSDAVARHDRILAVINGSAMNQDGRTNGLTAPNGRSQAALLRHALKDAGIEASQIGYVEAHGTGTPLGDPIEVEAISEVLGSGAAPCGLGSAKANIGHLEGAAGIAGVIRTVLTLQHGVIPPVANFHSLNPHILLGGTRLFVPSAPAPWPRAADARYAGVSSFGWSGTNAHVILGDPPAPANSLETPIIGRDVIVPVSAADPVSLQALTDSMAHAVAKQSESDTPAFAWSAGARRSHHSHRLAVVGADCKSIAAKLGERAASLLQAPHTSPPEITIFFSPERSESSKIIAQLLAQEPIFKEAVGRCAREMKAAGAHEDLLTDIRGDVQPLQSELHERAAAFLLQFALTELLKSWGVHARNTSVEGVGSVMAALTNGTIDLNQAVVNVLNGQYSVPMPAEDRGDSARSITLVLGHGHPHLNIAAERQLVYLLQPSLSARRSLLQAVASLYEAGTEIDWDAVSGSDRRLIPLPAYPFRHNFAPGFTPLAAEAPNDWFYETVWPEMPITMRTQQQTETQATRWIIVADESGFAERLSQALSRAGQDAILVRLQDSLVQGTVNSDGEAEDFFGRAFESIDRDEAVIVVYPLALDLTDLDLTCDSESRNGVDKNRHSNIDLVLDASMNLVHLCRALQMRAATRSIKLWVATRGAQRLPHQANPSSLVQSPLWGFSASAALEHPDLWGGMVDLDPLPTPDDATLFIGHITAHDGESRALFRNGRRHVARLRQATPPPHTPVRIDPYATYLLTGAFGGIGLALAEWLVDSGAKHLLLLGRQPTLRTATDADFENTFERWQALGVIVRRAACDVADLDQMSALFSEVNKSGYPIRGILHAAAEVVWKPLLDLTSGDLRASFHAKAAGSLVLHELCKNLSLDFLAFFSSAAVPVGARDACAYAAANAFMDSLALQRCDMGLRTISIQWGNWQRKQDHARVGQQQFARSGFHAMSSGRATNALSRLLAQDTPPASSNHVMVAHLDRSVLQAATAMRGQTLFLSELGSSRPSLQKATVNPLVATLAALSRARKIGALADLVTTRVRHTLGWTTNHPVDPTRGFFDMGFDSLKSIELKNALSQATGLSLSSTLVMTYPNVNAVAGFLNALMFGEESHKHLSPRSGQAAPTSEDLTDAQARDALAVELDLLRGRFDA